jgi:hypothetical protein
MLDMSKLELLINYEFILVDHNKKHKFTINITGDGVADIVDNANKLRRELFQLYSKDCIRITDKVTFQSGEELPRI